MFNINNVTFSHPNPSLVKRSNPSFPAPLPKVKKIETNELLHLTNAFNQNTTHSIEEIESNLQRTLRHCIQNHESEMSVKRNIDEQILLLFQLSPYYRNSQTSDLYFQYKCSHLPLIIKELSDIDPSFLILIKELPLQSMQKIFNQSESICCKNQDYSLLIEIKKFIESECSICKHIFLFKNIDLNSKKIRNVIAPILKNNNFNALNLFIEFIKTDDFNEKDLVCINYFIDHSLDIQPISTALAFLKQVKKSELYPLIDSSINWIDFRINFFINNSLLKEILQEKIHSSPVVNAQMINVLLKVSIKDPLFARELNVFFKGLSPYQLEKLSFQIDACFDFKTIIRWINATQNSSAKSKKKFLFCCLKLSKTADPLFNWMVTTISSENLNRIERLNNKKLALITSHSLTLIKYLGSSIDFAQTTVEIMNSYIDFLKNDPEISLLIDQWLSHLMSQGDVNSKLEKKIQSVPLEYHLLIQQILTSFPRSYSIKLLQIAQILPWDEQIGWVLKIAKEDTELGLKMIQFCLEKPMAASNLISLLPLDNSILKKVIETLEFADEHLVVRMFQLNNFNIRNYADKLEWLCHYPVHFEKWLTLTEYGMNLCINKTPPALIDLLVSDKLLRSACRLIHFPAINSILSTAFTNNPKLTNRLLIECSGYTNALKIFLKMISRSKMSTHSTALSRMLSLLDLDNKQQNSIFKLFLYHIDISEEPKNGFIEVISRLISLIDTNELELLERLLDLLKTADVKCVDDILNFKEQPSHLTPCFKQKCLEMADSIHGEFIHKLILLDPERDSDLIHFFLSDNITNNINIIKFVLKNRQYKGDVFSILTLSENNCSIEQRRLREALLTNKFSFFEYAVNREEVIWKDMPLWFQENIWKLHQTLGKDHRIIRIYLKLYHDQINRAALNDFTGIILYLEAHDRSFLEDNLMHDNDFEFMAKISHFMNSETFTDSISKLTDFSAQSSTDINYLPSLENDFAIAIADLLVTSDGRINIFAILILRRSTAFQKIPCTVFLKRLEIVLTWIEKDVEVFDQKLADLKIPENKTSQSYRLLTKMFPDKKIESRTAKVAVLSALLSRVRQSPEIGNCFSTQTSIETQTTYNGFCRTLDDYCELLNTDGLTLSVRGERKQYFYRIPKVHFDPSSQGNLLVKFRDYTIAQTSYLPKMNVFIKTTWDLFSHPSNPLFQIIEEITSEANEGGLMELILNTIRRILNDAIGAYYDPFLKHSNKSGLGGWRLTFNDKKIIKTPEQFINMLIEVVTRINLEAEIKNHSKVVTLKGIISNFLREIRKNEPDIKLKLEKKGIVFLLKSFQKFIKKPWIEKSGGKGMLLNANYYEQHGNIRIKTFVAETAEKTLLQILNYGKNLPNKIKENLNSEIGNIMLGVRLPGHICNIDLQVVNGILKEFEPEDYLEKIKMDAKQLRSTLISEEFKEKLILNFSNKFPNKYSTVFKHKISHSRSEQQNLGDFLDVAMNICNECNSKKKAADILCLWESIMRNLFSYEICKRIEVKGIIDTNHTKNLDDYQIGFGISLFTGKVVEYQIKSNQSTQVKLNFEEQRYCKGELAFKHHFPQIASP